MKELIAKELVSRVQDGDLIGVGTGSTVEAVVKALADRIKSEKLNLYAVPTSYQTAWSCEKVGFRVLARSFQGKIPWGFDGADALTRNLWAIKGKGGALLQEKILAARCEKFVIVAEKSKLVDSLDNRPIPIEVIPEAIALVEKGLAKLGAGEITLREGSGKHGPIVTEGGNLLIDVVFKKVSPELEPDIKSIVGIVESGLFISYASEAILGDANGTETILL